MNTVVPPDPWVVPGLELEGFFERESCLILASNLMEKTKIELIIDTVRSAHAHGYDVSLKYRGGAVILEWSKAPFGVH
jgi:hypothetical protein